MFSGAKKTTLAPDETDMAGFGEWMKGYHALLDVEREAVRTQR